MASIKNHEHRRAIANHFGWKVGEFDHQLRAIVAACDTAQIAYLRGRSCPNEKELVYAFSAFANAMQALKDGRQTLGDGGLTWNSITQLSHGAFMRQARNAIAHDGNPIINSWVNGRFFVALNISRLGSNGEPVEIARPVVDVRTFCLQFAEAFAARLGDSLRSLVGQFEIGGASFDRTELTMAVNETPIIPDVFKRMMIEHLDDIGVAIEEAAPFDPIVKSVGELDAISKFARQALTL